MSVRFVLGRAGAGKTRYCLDAVLSELAGDCPAGRLILLVPEQATFQIERALATGTPRGGYWQAEVLSFSRLARRILDQTGPTPVVVSTQSRVAALRRMVACGRELEVLRRAAQSQGFFVQLSRLIEELLREEVAPETLAALGQGLGQSDSGQKLCEIARLYGDYLSWLGPGRIDMAARLTLLRERLAQCGWLTEAKVWVDGFASFTRQELHTLVELARRARELTIALLVDPLAPAVRNPRQPPDPLGLFYRTELTYQRLLDLFAQAGVEVAPPIHLRPSPLPRFAGAPGLAGLEAALATPGGPEPEVSVENLPGSQRPGPQCRPGGQAAQTTAGSTGAHGPAALRVEDRWFGPGGGPRDGASEIRLVECATHRDELRAAARWIRAMVADSRGRLRFRDFAVIARDLAPFAHLAGEVFAEYEIPYFLDRRRPLRGHPLSRLLRGLLDAAGSDFAVRPMLRLLRTGLLPLSVDQAEQLENLLVRYCVVGQESWQRPTWELEDGVWGAAETLAPQRKRIVKALEPVVVLVRGGSADGATWARTLYGALTGLEVDRRVREWVQSARARRRWESAETYRLAWSGLCQVLEDLHDVLGDTPLSVGQVAAIVGSACDELTLGLAPPTVDQVLLTGIERSRHPDIRHAWVLAFNEGVFPARPPTEVLLSDAERRSLCQAGLSVGASRREDVFYERLLAYIAFTRPSASLTISYATVGDDGQELLPSPLLAEVRRALPALRATRLSDDEPPVNLNELATGYLGGLQERPGTREHERYRRLCEEVGRVPSLGRRLDRMLRGVHYRNVPGDVGNYGGPRSGCAEGVWDGTPSEVETYVDCPFKHFAKFGLKLEAAAGPSPLELELGRTAHEILAGVTERAIRAAVSVRDLPDQQWQEWLEAEVAACRERQPPDQPKRRPDLVFMRELLGRFLSEVIGAHAARWRRGQFQPLYCERGFRPEAGRGQLGAVELSLPDGRRFWLRGKIDRVDVCEQGDQKLLLVYDYKSGKVEGMKAEYLTGTRLQLFTYLLALWRAMEGAGSWRPAGVLAAPLFPNFDVLNSAYAATAPPAEQTMYLYRPRGLVEEVAARLLDGQLGRHPSPVAQLQLNRDGSFNRRSDVCSDQEMERRLELVERTLQMAVEGIVEGRIPVAPLLEKRRLACCYCEYQTVCRYDPAYNRARRAESVLPKLADGQTTEGEEA